MIDMNTLKPGDKVVGARGTERVSAVGQLSFLYMHNGTERQGLPEDFDPFTQPLVDDQQVYRVQADGDLKPVPAALATGKFIRILAFERISITP